MGVRCKPNVIDLLLSLSLLLSYPVSSGHGFLLLRSDSPPLFVVKPLLSVSLSSSLQSHSISLLRSIAMFTFLLRLFQLLEQLVIVLELSR